MTKSLMKVSMVLCLAWAGAATAQDKSFELSAPSELLESGLLKHLLPRFSLKTGIRITISEGSATVTFGEEGTPVFKRGETVWRMARQNTEATDTFAGWLLSDVGKRTIEGFQPASGAPFSADVTEAKAAVVIELTGDAALGEELSMVQCGRCHVINDSNRMNAIGSSPSFAVMRTFPDWQERFETFFMLKPHPAFTQVEDVTDPFPEHLPSPIAPIEVTLEDIEAITAFVGSIAPADLGAPIQTGVFQTE